MHVAELLAPGRTAVEAYLDAVAADVADYLRPRVRAAVLVEDRLVADDHAHLLAEAAERGLDERRAAAVVAELAAELGAVVEPVAGRGGRSDGHAGRRPPGRRAPGPATDRVAGRSTGGRRRAPGRGRRRDAGGRGVDGGRADRRAAAGDGPGGPAGASGRAAGGVARPGRGRPEGPADRAGAAAPRAGGPARRPPAGGAGAGRRRGGRGRHRPGGRAGAGAGRRGRRRARRRRAPGGRGRRRGGRAALGGRRRRARRPRPHGVGRRPRPRGAAVPGPRARSCGRASGSRPRSPDRTPSARRRCGRVLADCRDHDGARQALEQLTVAPPDPARVGQRRARPARRRRGAVGPVDRRTASPTACAACARTARGRWSAG